MTTSETLNQALHAERRGQFDQARTLLRQAYRANPSDSHDLAMRLGKLCILAGPTAYDEAETILNGAYAHAEQQGAPRSANTALHLLALLAIHRHRYDEAASILEQSSALQQTSAPGPETGQLFHYRGLVTAGQGDLANAERFLHRACQLYGEVNYEPGLGEVYDSLANLLLR